MRGIIITLILFLCYGVQSKAQSITPSTINIGGFDATQGGYSLTISTGETISITDFKSPNGVGLSSGFLQNNPPLVTSVDELNMPFGPNEIKITPNPVQTKRTKIGYVRYGYESQLKLLGHFLF